MAFRRSVSARAKLFYQQQPRRAAIPLSRIDRDDVDRRRQGLPTFDLRRGGNVASFSFSGSRNLFGVPAAYAPIFVRNMSSSAGEGQAAEKLMNEGAKKAMEEVSPLTNELLLQDFMNYLDTFTIFDGCASITLGIVFIRMLLLPLTKHRFKTDLIKSEMVKIEEEMKSSDKSPVAMAASVARMTELSKAHGVYGFTNMVLYTASVVSLFSIAMVRVEVMKFGVTYLSALLTAPHAIFVTFFVMGFMEGALSCWIIKFTIYEFAVAFAMISPRWMKILGLSNEPKPRISIKVRKSDGDR